MTTERSRIWMALGSLYVIWGSTFLGIRIALEGFPPLLLAGLRFVIAGAVTYAFVRARGAPAPTRTEWRSSLSGADRGTLRPLAIAGRVDGPRHRTRRSRHPPDRRRSAGEPRRSAGVDGELRELGAGIHLQPPAAAAGGADGQRGADVGRRPGDAGARPALRRADDGSALGALRPRARVSHRRRIDRRLQRVPVPPLTSAPDPGGELCVREPGGGGGPGRCPGRRKRGSPRGRRAGVDPGRSGHAGAAQAGCIAGGWGRAYLPGMSVRVAHLIYGLGFGGLEQLVIQLAARSRARGIESSILALGHDGPTRELALKQGVPVELLPVDGLSFPALMGIRRELEKRDASVLHAHDLGPWLNGVAVRALRPKTRVMATFHEQRTPEGKRRHAAALAARATDVLVACGDKVREDILDWAPSGSRVPVIA